MPIKSGLELLVVWTSSFFLIDLNKYCITICFFTSSCPLNYLPNLLPQLFIFIISNEWQEKFFRTQLQKFSNFLDEDGEMSSRISFLSKKLEENKTKRQRLVSLLECCNTNEAEDEILSQLKRINAYSMRYAKELINHHSSINLINDLHYELTLKTL